MEKFKKDCLSKKIGKAEIITIILYVIGVIAVGCFHEPCFDELQAWGIARSASIKDIIFKIPHYEGHPPLWHLILAIFAKTGVPFKIALKLISTSFAACAVALLLFKSPFPKIVRCTLPFSFFLFYQYAVISRPYSIMMVAVFLAAITYKNRDQHPWRYILSLSLLCLTSAYGIAIAGGLCLVWTFEILSKIVKEKKYDTILKDKRAYSLAAILVLAVMLIITIHPADDCWYSGVEDYDFLDHIKNISNTVFLISFPFDSFSGNLFTYNDDISLIPAIVYSVVGAITWTALISVTHKNKKLIVFLMSYLPFSLILAYKYASAHHYGISVVMIIFIFWIMCDSEEGLAVPEFYGKIWAKFESGLIKKIVCIFGAGLYAMSIVYSVASSIIEIKKEYGPESIAKLIIDNNLENEKLMLYWCFEYDFEEKVDVDTNNIFYFAGLPSKHSKVLKEYTYLTSLGPILNQYFEKNIFMNHNIDCPDDLYMHYQYKEDSEKIKAQWAEQGLPDFIIGYCPIDAVYDKKTLDGVVYGVIAIDESNLIYKFDTYTIKTYIYMREDLLDKYPQFEFMYDPKIANKGFKNVTELK